MTRFRKLMGKLEKEWSDHSDDWRRNSYCMLEQYQMA